MSYYQRHVFFCLHQRADNQQSCAAQGAQAGFDRCKQQAKAAGIAGPGQVRVNRSGCLNRCAGGPVAVVYPEGTWYTFVDAADIDELVACHLHKGQVVDRLALPPDTGR
ncbi:MAG: (2Fe-2S) ferredoxin domain-containing protein [Pseudomonadota bacterium]